MAGMGRGAGNTNTELIMQYMNRKYNSGYDIDTVLDLSHNYIDGIVTPVHGDIQSRIILPDRTVRM